MVLSSHLSDFVISSQKKPMETTPDVQNYFTQSLNFEEAALNLFRYQANKNNFYRQYLDLLGIDPAQIKEISDIPFLPVDFFKHFKIFIPDKHVEIFTSSTTGGGMPSQHFVSNLETYEKSFIEGFRFFYGNPEEFCFLALLPGYLERTGSSLVYMANKLIEISRYNQSGFFLNDHDELLKNLVQNEENNIPTMLLGVTFGLLDFAEKHQLKLNNTIIMETGGMKGRRKEMIREEVHAILKASFGVDAIHSEYGMTELLSQAYSDGNGLYTTPPWMKVLTYDIYNPLFTSQHGKGGLNIIDLANIDSCAFLQTHDIATVYENGTFEVLGRLDASDVRGCNLMVI